eukprot:m51a1_g6382 hypothetical protein (3599) ;mRNA; r:157563-171699
MVMRVRLAQIVYWTNVSANLTVGYSKTVTTALESHTVTTERQSTVVTLNVKLTFHDSSSATLTARCVVPADLPDSAEWSAAWDGSLSPDTISRYGETLVDGQSFDGQPPLVLGSASAPSLSPVASSAASTVAALSLDVGMRLAGWDALPSVPSGVTVRGAFLVPGEGGATTDSSATIAGSLRLSDGSSPMGALVTATLQCSQGSCPQRLVDELEGLASAGLRGVECDVVRSTLVSRSGVSMLVGDAGVVALGTSARTQATLKCGSDGVVSLDLRASSAPLRQLWPLNDVGGDSNEEPASKRAKRQIAVVSMIGAGDPLKATGTRRGVVGSVSAVGDMFGISGAGAWLVDSTVTTEEAVVNATKELVKAMREYKPTPTDGLNNAMLGAVFPMTDGAIAQAASSALANSASKAFRGVLADVLRALFPEPLQVSFSGDRSITVAYSPRRRYSVKIAKGDVEALSSEQLGNTLCGYSKHSSPCNATTFGAVFQDGTAIFSVDMAAELRWRDGPGNWNAAVKRASLGAVFQSEVTVKNSEAKLDDKAVGTIRGYFPVGEAPVVDVEFNPLKGEVKDRLMKLERSAGGDLFHISQAIENQTSTNKGYTFSTAGPSLAKLTRGISALVNGSTANTKWGDFKMDLRRAVELYLATDQTVGDVSIYSPSSFDDSNSFEFVVSASFVALRGVTISGCSSADQFIPLEQVAQFPVVVSGGIKLHVTRTSARVVWKHYDFAHSATGWALPFQRSLMSADVDPSSTSLEASFDMHNGLVFSAGLRGSLQVGRAFEFGIVANKSTAETENQFTISFGFDSGEDDSARTVSPQDVIMVSSAMQGLLPAVVDDYFASAIPPLTRPLSAFLPKLPQFATTAWYTMPITTGSALYSAHFANLSFPTGQFFYEVKINGDDIRNCTVIYGITPLIDAANAFVQACLGGYVTASTTKIDGGETLKLMPTVEGRVYALSMSCNSSAKGVLFERASYHAPSMSRALSFADLSILVSRAVVTAGSNRTRPVLSYWDSSRFVSRDYIDYFASSIPVISWSETASFDAHYNVNVTAAISMANSVSGNSTLSLQMSKDTANATAIPIGAKIRYRASSMVGVSFACFRGDENVVLTTAMISPHEIVTPANKTFDFTVSFEKREKSRRSVLGVLEQATVTINLVEGISVNASLSSSFMTSISKSTSPHKAQLERMLSVFTDSDATLQRYEAVFVARVYTDNGALYVPISLGITRSSVPGIGGGLTKQESTPKRLCPFFSDLTMDFKTEARGNVYATGGALGVLDLADKGDVSIAGSVSFSASLPGIQVASLREALMAASERGYNTTAVSVDAQQGFRINASNLALQGFRNNSLADGLSAATLAFEYSYSDTPELSVHGSQKAMAAVAMLRQLGTLDLCSFVSVAEPELYQFKDGNTLSRFIPFTSRKPINVFDSDVYNPIMTMHKSVCLSVNPKMTVGELCNHYMAAINVSCAGLAIATQGNTTILSLPLDRTVKRSEQLPFLIPMDMVKDLPSDIETASGLNYALESYARYTVLASVAGGADVHIVARNVTIKSRASTNLETNIMATVSGISLNMVGSVLQVDTSTELKASGALEYAVSGSLDTTTDEPVACSLLLMYPDASVAFNRKIAQESRCNDGGSFAEALSKYLETSSIEGVISTNPTELWRTYERRIQEKADEFIANIDFPAHFIGSGLTSAVDELFNKLIVNTDIAKAINTELTQVGKNISFAKKGNSTNATAMPAPEAPKAGFVPKIITTIINKAFNSIAGKYLRRNPVTLVPHNNKSFDMVFNFQGNYGAPIPSFSFDIGSHGVASLRLNCTPLVMLDFGLRFFVSFSPSGGFRVGFVPEEEAFGASVSLGVDQCSAEGELIALALGMDIKAAFTGRISLKVTNSSDVAPVGITFDAHINGTGTLGLSQKIQNEISGKKLGLSLPYFKANMGVVWTPFNIFNASTFDAKPRIYFGGLKFCLGGFISGYARKYMQEVRDILKPIDPLIGEHSFLFENIDGLVPVLGHENPNMYGILRLFCFMDQPGCNLTSFDHFMQFVRDMFTDIAIIEKLAQQMADDKDMCGDMSLLADIFIDSSHPKLTHQQTNYSKIIENIPSKNPIDSGLRRRWTSSSSVPRSFGITTPLLKPAQLPTILMKMIGGEDFALLTVVFPPVVFHLKYVYRYPIIVPVITMPVGALSLGLDVTLTFQAPPLIVSGKALFTAISTGRLDVLGSAIEIDTRPWVASVEIAFTGGLELEVGFWIVIDIEIDFSIIVTVRARFHSIDGDPIVPLAAMVLQIIRKPLESFALQVNVDVGIVFKIGGCVDLLFTKKCQTFWSIGARFNLWKKDFVPPVLTGLNDGGRVNVNAVMYHENYCTLLSGGCSTPVISVTQRGDTAVASLTPVDSVLTSAITKTFPRGAVFTDGCPRCPTGRFDVIVNGVMAQGASLPSCERMNLTVMQRPYRSSRSLTLTANGIYPANSSALLLRGACGNLTLGDPVPAMQVHVTGLPCNTVLKTAIGAKVFLSGTIKDFSEHLLVISGDVRTIDIDIPATIVEMTSTGFLITDRSGGQPLKIEAPNTVAAVTGKGHPVLPSNYRLLSVAKGSRTTVTGGSGDSLFVIPNFTDVVGVASLVGSNSAHNSMNLDFNLTAGRHVTLQASSNHVAVVDGADAATNMVLFTNINNRVYTIKAAQGASATLQMMQAKSHEIVTVRNVAEEKSYLRSEVRSCDLQSVVHVTLGGNGSHTVVIGSDKGVAGMSCSIQVAAISEMGTDLRANRIIVNASADIRPLTWDSTPGVLKVANGNGPTTELLEIVYDNVGTVEMVFGAGGTRANLHGSRNGVEMLLEFPAERSAWASNVLRVQQTMATVLVTGSLDELDLGPEAPVGDATPGSLPFSGMQGKVVLGRTVAGGTPLTVVVESASSASSPAHSFAMTANTLSEASLPTRTVAPSTNMSAALRVANGDDWLPAAPFYFPALPVGSKFIIRTGGGADTFQMTGVLAPVTISAGAGSDTLVWRRPGTDVALTAELGMGPDNALLETTSAVNVDLGSDADADVVEVSYGAGTSPSFVDNVVQQRGAAPIVLEGTADKDALVVTRLSAPIPRPTTGTRSARDDSDIELGAGEPAVELSMATMGMRLRYQQEPGNYALTHMAAGCSAALWSSGAGYTAPGPVATRVALDDYSMQCNVSITAATHSSSEAGIEFGSAVHVPEAIELSGDNATATGVLQLGTVRVVLAGIDHTYLAVDATNPQSPASTITVSSPPGSTDLALRVPGCAWRVEVQPGASEQSVLSVNGTLSGLALRLMDVELVRVRLRCWAFIGEFEERLAEVGPPAVAVQKACKELLDSECLRDLLAAALAIGNYLNGSNAQRGQADGFSVEALEKMVDLRDAQGTGSLFDHAVRYVGRRTLPDELPSVRHAAGIEFKAIQAAFNKLAAELQELNVATREALATTPLASGDHFPADAQRFFGEAATRLANLREEVVRTEQLFLDTVDFFTVSRESTLQYTTESFFGMWGRIIGFFACSTAKQAPKPKPRLLKLGSNKNDADPIARVIKDIKRGRVSSRVSRAGLPPALKRMTQVMTPEMIAQAFMDFETQDSAAPSTQHSAAAASNDNA